MFITKMALPRRTFLKGLGATVALPLLDAMTPALTAASRTAANPVMRMGFFYVPNGMFLPNFHPGGTGGRAFELTPILKPLEPFRDQITVVSGLSNLGVISPAWRRAHNGARRLAERRALKRTEGAGHHGGQDIDRTRRQLGADTRCAH
jgi:hypothetical protein